MYVVLGWVLVVVFSMNFGLLSSSKTSTTDMSASELTRSAFELVQGGNLELAVAYFRAACHRNSSNAEYWNNLGVTEMRLQLFDNALLRFKTALQVDANYSIAQENIEDILLYVGQNGMRIEPRRRSAKHKIKRLPRIHLKDIFRAENKPFLELQRAFILEGADGDWDISLWNLESISQLFPEADADFYPQNMQRSDVQPLFTKLWHSIDILNLSLSSNVSIPFSSSYIQWNVKEEEWNRLQSTKLIGSMPYFLTQDEQWIKECFHDEDSRTNFEINTHWRMILIGEKGSGMFNHQDTLHTASWQFQLKGAKRWHICPSSQSWAMYRPGEVNTFDVDYENFPRMKNATCYMDVVREREVLFYPKNYWHQTENLHTPTISVTSTVVDSNCYSDVMRMLRNQCEAGRTFLPEICSALHSTCFRNWKLTFGEENKWMKRSSVHGATCPNVW